MELKLNKQKITVSLISAIIILLSASPSFMLNESSMNMFLIGFMGISPILLLLYLKSIAKEDVLLILFLLSITFIPQVNQPEAMRWSTIIFSWMFSLLFLTYKQLLLENAFDINTFLKLLRYLIYAYAIVLIVQQICVLVGLPVFLASHYNPTEPWKLNSLAAEPSWTARSVAFLMFCYIIVKEIILDKKYSFKDEFKIDKYLWISFFWTMLTMGSGTAFLFIFLVLSIFLRLKTIFMFIFIFVILLGIINYFEITAADRAINLFIAALTLDPQAMILADASGSSRIIPFIVLLEKVNITTIDGWFGHGIDYVANNLYMYFAIKIKGVGGGGMLELWMNYGFISFILFLVFSLVTTLNRKNFKLIIFWFFLVFMYGVNSQLVWMFILIAFTINYFMKNIKENHKIYIIRN